jgi:thymidylate synthase
MAKIDFEFQELCNTILNNGKEYNNVRRGVKRLQIPSYTLKHSFEDGFPALTNKELYWKGVVGELIWFLKGDNDIKFLNDNGIKFWNDDAFNWHTKHKGTLSSKEFEEKGQGSVGKNYSIQWRNFNGNTDQIKDLIEGMKKDIMGSRLIVSAWNPSELNETALPPCHNFFQVIGVPLDNGEFGFELHWNQRSVDTFLGVPLNIASYALLAKVLEKITGYKAIGIEGTLKCVHFYDNQYDAVKELLKRDPNTHKNCEISIPELKGNDIDEILKDVSILDFKLVDYTSDEKIKVKMLAPKEI